MSLCAEIRELMLEAEPRALSGEGDDAVAHHLRNCPACAELGRRILDDAEDLRTFLGGWRETPDVDAILEAAGHFDKAPATVLSFPRWRTWAVAAAAAVVAGLLLIPGEAPLVESPRRAPPTPPLVEVAPGQNVAVMATANPDITVLWFYN